MNTPVLVTQPESSASEAEQQQWLCPSSFCDFEVLSVKRCAGQADLWQITSDDGSAWIVAAVTPVCPGCGATLLTLAEQS